MDNTVHWIMNLYPVHRVTAFPNVYSPTRFIWWIALCNVWKLVYRFCQTLHKIWSLDLYLKHLFLPWDINEGTWLPQCREDGTLWKIKETFWIIECSFSAEYWILTTMKTWLLGFDVSNQKKWRGDPMPGSGFGVWLMLIMKASRQEWPQWNFWSFFLVCSDFPNVLHVNQDWLFCSSV